MERKGGQEEATPYNGEQAHGYDQDQQILRIQLHIVAHMPKKQVSGFNAKKQEWCPCQILWRSCQNKKWLSCQYHKMASKPVEVAP